MLLSFFISSAKLLIVRSSLLQDAPADPEPKDDPLGEHRRPQHMAGAAGGRPSFFTGHRDSKPDQLRAAGGLRRLLLPRHQERPPRRTQRKIEEDMYVNLLLIYIFQANLKKINNFFAVIKLQTLLLPFDDN